MNESHPSPSAGGQKRSGLRSDMKPPQTSPLHTSANQEARSEKNVWKVEQTCESWGKNDNTQQIVRLRQYETGSVWFNNWRKRPHTTTHVHTEWNPRELVGSDHNPLPPAPPLREGHHSGPNGLANSDPEPPLAPQPPLLLRIHLPPCFFLLLFSTAFFLSLSVAFCLFSFKLVYRTRREAACGKELSLLSFDDVISVVVPQWTFFLWREKKPAVSSLFSFCSLFVSTFLLFFVNDNKKDLPLNVQDVFSHTWTGF